MQQPRIDPVSRQDLPEGQLNGDPMSVYKYAISHRPTPNLRVGVVV